VNRFIVASVILARLIAQLCRAVATSIFADLLRLSGRHYTSRKMHYDMAFAGEGEAEILALISARLSSSFCFRSSANFNNFSTSFNAAIVSSLSLCALCVTLAVPACLDDSVGTAGVTTEAGGGGGDAEGGVAGAFGKSDKMDARCF
jgi:hypothetical protein